MWKNITFWSLIAVLALSSASASATEIYGTGVELETQTTIADILAEPEAWAGKTVRVEGKVVGVCAKKGCWLELESLDGDRLRIKVEDDVIVFPQEAKGRWAVAQGTVSVNEMSREGWVAWKRHLAEEMGKAFDEASLGDGPYRLIQVQGSGAEIEGP